MNYLGVTNLFIKYRVLGILSALCIQDLYLALVFFTPKHFFMSRRIVFPFLFILTLIAGPLTKLNAQNCDPITRSQLREILVQLGYEVKDLEKTPGKEKYEVMHKTSSFNVPVGYEISASTNYIWLTVNLGPKPLESSSKNYQLLHQNAIIQPCQFYTSDSGNLMLALAIENRGVTNAMIRTKSDLIAAKVGETSTYWQGN